MIDIRTLRIGSHVLVDGKRERVRGLDEGNGLIVRFPAEYVSACEVEPIPITSALLEELGFECKDHGYFEHWWKGGFDFTHKPDSPYWTHDGGIDVEFLHELETLHNLIYGVELITE